MDSETRFAVPFFVGLIFRNISDQKLPTFRLVYKYYVLFFTFVIYVCYHLSRKPLSVVKNQLNPCSDNASDNCTGGWEPFDGQGGKRNLGALDSCYLFTYAFCMFLSGHIAERTNLRYFLFIGMLLSGLTTALFGFGKYWTIHSFWYFALVQVLSGVVQSTGWPPVVACVANWFGKSKRGLIMGVWNSHTSVGNILGSLIAGTMVNVDWAWSFIIPGIIIAFIGLLVFISLVPHPRDFSSNSNFSASPWDNQDEERARLIVENSNDDENPINSNNIDNNNDDSDANSANINAQPIGFLKAILIPGVIEFSLCLFFAKLVSYTFLFWLPYYISKTANYNSAQSADMSTLFDVGGILGGIFAGFVSDYHGGRALTCMCMLFVAAPTMLAYFLFGSLSFGLCVFLLILCGFFVNGPYSLITTAVSADLGTHPSLKGDSRALSTVTAIIDGTGSIGAAVGPLMTGLISSYGWDYVFYMLIASDILALLVSMYVYFVLDAASVGDDNKGVTAAAAGLRRGVDDGEKEGGRGEPWSWGEKLKLAWSKRVLLIFPNLSVFFVLPSSNRLPSISCCHLNPYRFRISLGQWLAILFAILCLSFVYLFLFNKTALWKDNLA